MSKRYQHTYYWKNRRKIIPNQVQWNRNKTARLKSMALDAFGNKCGCCGYDTHLEALEFHHLDPSEKESGMSSMMRSRSWKAIVEELRKCILVCPTCHREVHLGFREIHNTIQRFDELYSTYISPQGQIIGRD